jgi:glycine cleavage system transcriptional repressor
MQVNTVISFTGKDRVGLVEDVTGVLLKFGGNVETSRMVRLGGEFAMLMLVSVPAEGLAGLEAALNDLMAQGFTVTIRHTARTADAPRVDAAPYQICVVGADHEGIIHDIAAYLADRGINIESMDTETAPAPNSGAPLFSMSALVAVPSTLLSEKWESALDAVGQRLNVDIDVKSVSSVSPQ